MKTIKGLRALRRPMPPTVLTMGVFDGVHVGHRKIIKSIVDEARRRKLTSVVVTFEPHPMKVIAAYAKIPSLISLKHRMRIIEELGVDVVVVLRFSKAFANIAAEDFIKDTLVDKLGMKTVYIGSNFYFGRGGRSGVKDLYRLGKKFGFKTVSVKPVKVHGRAASSSLIRHLIMTGKIDEASELLDRRVSILGTVISGARLARELGYPTANLNPHHEVIPPSGVYAVFVRLNDAIYKGILNIGIRPTFYAPRDREPAMEVHIFDFKEKIYGKDLEVFFVKKLRAEETFKNREELISQIKIDENRAKKAFRGTKAYFS